MCSAKNGFPLLLILLVWRCWLGDSSVQGGWRGPKTAMGTAFTPEIHLSNSMSLIFLSPFCVIIPVSTAILTMFIKINGYMSVQLQKCGYNVSSGLASWRLSNLIVRNITHMCFWEYFNEVIRYQTIFIHDEILLGNKYRNGQTDSINNSFQNILQWAA